MHKKSTILILINEPGEHEALVQTLNSGSYSIAHKNCRSVDQLYAILRQREWDLVIGKEGLLSFQETSFIEIIQKQSPHLPIIAVLGKDRPEEAGVQVMEAGARDYVHIKKLQRLAPIVKRELTRSKPQTDPAEPSWDQQLHWNLVDYVCHEVRTSLTSITILSRLLLKNRKKHLNDLEMKYAEGITICSNTILKLVNSVLNQTEETAPDSPFTMQKISIQALCQNLKQIFSPIAADKHLSFSIEIHNSRVPRLNTYLLYLEQTLHNLISNAIKFTKKGQVSVSIYTLTAEETKEIEINSEEVIAFEIQDTGIGIPKNKQELILESYTQADETIKTQFGGTGLGLTICKNNLDLLGGKLEVESQEGAGSTFTAYLPVENSTAGMIRNKEKIDDPQGFNFQGEETSGEIQKQKVLLVDDSHMQSSALSELLSAHSSDCSVASSAKEAYQHLHRESFDYIILDMILPDANGLDIIKHMKQKFNLSDTHVVIYTGKNLAPVENQQLHSYVDEVVLKNMNSYQKIVDIVTYSSASQTT